MAKTVINPEAELAARSGDIELSLDQLSLLDVFATLKKAPAFAKFPGTYVLRRFRAGEMICRQGDSGGTAFYLLTANDVEALTKSRAADGEAATPDAPISPPPELVRYATELRRGPSDGKARRVATARLIVDSVASPDARGARSWWKFYRRTGTAQRRLARPTAIANDGPTDIDYQSRQAAIYDGEVFGEMSCLTRQPRSATVVADTECFALEFLRNILDQMRKDPDYKKQSDAQYRGRVMEGHLRQLSIFRLLSDREFSEAVNEVELKDFAAGTVLWDEGDAADAVYVVRSGIVQVVQSFPWRMTKSEVSDWPKLLERLRGGAEASPAIGKLVAALPKELQQSLAEPSDPPPADLAARLVAALSELAKTDALLSAKEVQPVLLESLFERETSEYVGKPKAWTGLQLRRGNRILYHLLFPDLVKPPAPAGLARVLQYVGRGGILGEIGVMLDQLRSATCVAYAHSETDRESTNVELARVPAEVIRRLAAQSPAVRAEINKLAAARKERDRLRPKAPLAGEFQSRRVEELGLQQGQNLMLIDLDRCTRCGDCVEACIATHDDGHSRLYLDGPRFGKYLVPSSCRQCRDPVCMIGCPVGSIQPGDDGEVVIREWCIGCGVCARQCPYDSIQMHDAAIVPSGLPGWRWAGDRDTAQSANWLEAKFDASDWNAGATPFQWDVGLQQEVIQRTTTGKVGGPARRLYFRHNFEHRAAPSEHEEGFGLTATSQSASVEVYLNGSKLELTQDAAQKKRGLYVCQLPADALRPGTNALAAVVEVPDEFGAAVFDLRLDRLAPETAEFEEKAVTERAVVCDQCSSLSGDRHACVYACPHEAALRVDAWIELPAM